MSASPRMPGSVGVIGLFAALLVGIPLTLTAADPQPRVSSVMQGLLNGIHVTPQVIPRPFPFYAEKYLPFAMAASMESTRRGRLWMLSRGMKEAFRSFSQEGGRTWQPQSTFFPHVNSNAVFRRLASGNLLLVKDGRDLATAPQWKGQDDWGVRKERAAFLSRDDR